MVSMPAHQHAAWQTLTKVPKVTLYFWISKLLTTAMGESTSDYLVNRINPYAAVAIGFIILVIGLLVQFRARRYNPVTYWAAALAVSIAGTMGADVVHVALGVPYLISVIFYAAVLAIIFYVWQRSEGTLSIHSVYTRRRELFYWATVLATFALGTATGDLTAYSLHLGFLASGIVFAIVFAIPAVAYWRFRINPILAFWFAYIFTRPLGASFADWTGKSKDAGGLGWGDGPVTAVLAALIIILVTYLAVSRVDSQTSPHSAQKRLSPEA